jgi:hypothetical protein
MWRYQTPVGTFWIRPRGRVFVLGIGDEDLGSYHSPQAAADDVFTRVTGYDPWDSSDVLDGEEPTDLSEWSHR